MISLFGVPDIDHDKSTANDNISSATLIAVLSHYTLGQVTAVTQLNRGSRLSQKWVVKGTNGTYLLKKRNLLLQHRSHMSLAHQVQDFLRQFGYPVAELIKTSKSKCAYVSHDKEVYELTSFIHGSRFDGSVEETLDAGKHLSYFHELLLNFKSEQPFHARSYHQQEMVDKQIQKLIAQLKKIDVSPDHAEQVANHLAACYQKAGALAEGESAFVKEQVISHGDYHSGNLLFADGKMVALIDFDSLRLTSRLEDIANGCLQFSLVVKTKDPKNWPPEIHIARAKAFLTGVSATLAHSESQMKCIVALMAESLIAEAVAPSHWQGHFSTQGGADFIDMVIRKVDWLLTKGHDQIKKQ